MTDHKDNTDHTDCDHDHDELSVIKVMFDGEDEEVPCDVLGIFDVDGKEYIALIPQDSEDDVLLYGFEEKDDELNLLEIETDEEYEKAAKAFEEGFFDAE